MSARPEPPPWDQLWIHAHLATMDPTGESGDEPYGAIRHGALAIRGDRIAWVGPMDALPGEPQDLASTVHDAGGRWLTPGLIDCHTHLVFGGDRAQEFEMRLGGASYEAIARAGGGIRSSVKATRDASEDELVDTARRRLGWLLREGVTTVEVKSGYGLDLDTELRMLRAARRLAAETPVRVRTTFLGAHAVPEEFHGRPEAYLDVVCESMLPAVAEAGLADAVDAFCEGIAFSPEQTARVFERARDLGLPVKLHADQLSDLGGAALAARFGALSADHLEYTSDAGAAALAEAGTVAVLLPGAFYVLRESQRPPVDAFRRHGVPMAIATDCNPGSSPVGSLLLMLNMACTSFHLTPEEALAGVTVHAARALGLGDEVGRLAPGLRADIVEWDISRPAELCYWLGAELRRRVVFGGTWAALSGSGSPADGA